MRLSSGVADCLRVHLARRRGGARLWLSPLSAFVYSLVSLSRCRHVDTCTRLDSFLVCRSFRPVDFDDPSDDGLVHHAGLVNLAFPILLSWPISPCGELLVQIRRGLRPLRPGSESRLQKPDQSDGVTRMRRAAAPASAAQCHTECAMETRIDPAHRPPGAPAKGAKSPQAPRIIAKLESRGSRGFREISDFELELASASL